MSKLLKLKSAKVIISLMLGVAMLVSAGSASAALTTDQVNAILGLLNSFGADATTVANVQASLTGGTPVVSQPGTSLNFGTATLKVGSKGMYVKDLQTLVGAVADGNFGPNTKAKVMAWQSANGLVADGVFGAKSRAVAVGVVVVPPITPPVVTTPTGPVSVALATDNPASGSFLTNASGVVFAKYTFSGTGTITSVKLLRTGISSSSTLSNIYLYDGATRLTDGASIGSDNTVTFNALGGIFTVAGSKTISVVATTANITADYSLGINLVGYTANGTAVTANVVGNQMFGATATLATVALAAATGSGATDAGVDINVWQSTATVSTRDVLLKSLALRQIGSITAADIKNFKLYADGVLVATVANLDSNGYVTFGTPVVLKTGARILKVTADIIGGSSRTVSMSLRGTYDFLATDTQYNANGVATGTFPNTVTAFTVNAGTMTVVKATNSPSSNITVGGSDVNLATYTFTAYGEPIKVETLNVGMITTGGTVTNHTLRNVRILVNGAQVGSNTSVPAAASFAAASGTQFTTNFVVYPGTPATVEIHSDIYDNEGDDNFTVATLATTIQVALIGGTTSNGVPQTSLGTISVPSTSASNGVTGNVVSVSSGSMTLAKTSSYANRSIAVPATAYKIGSYQLSGNSTEAVNLNTLYVGWDSAATGAEATDLSDLYVVYGGTMTPVKGTVSATETNGNSWSINKTLAVNETMAIDVYATVASSLTTNTIISTMAVAGTTASSGIATYADASGATSLTAGVVGQTITGATGSVTMSNDASTAVAQIVDDSGTLKTLTAKIVALTDSYTVTDMTVTIVDASAVSSVTLKDATTGAVIGASKPGATSLTWSGLSLAVAAGETKKVDVELALSPVGVSAGTSDAALTTAITAFTARSSAGTSGAGSGSASGNAIYIYKAIPTVSVAALPNSSLAVSEMVIAKFTVSSNGTGTVAWKQAMFEITKSAAPTLSAATLWNSETGLQVTAASVYQNGTTGAATTCLADNVFCELLITVGTNADDNVVEQVSGSKTYEIRATVGGTLATGNGIAVKLDRNTVSHAASADFTTNKNSGAGGVSFVWSDESNALTSDTGVAVWQKDFLVKNLPLNWNLNRN